MKTLKPLLLLLAVSFLLCSGMKCKKDRTEPEPQLPAETQTGANTFGCLVDGKVFLPKGSFPYAGLSASIQFDILNLSANHPKEAIGISIRNVNVIGEYVYMNDNNFGYSMNGQNYNATDGKVIITKFDKTNKIISGRFYFNTKDSQTSKTISITEGRFDVKYTD